MHAVADLAVVFFGSCEPPLLILATHLQLSSTHCFSAFCTSTGEALFPGLDLDSGLDWTLDWTHGLWLNSALEHSLKPDQLVDALAIALALCKSWIISINAGI